MSGSWSGALISRPIATVGVSVQACTAERKVFLSSYLQVVPLLRWVLPRLLNLRAKVGGQRAQMMVLYHLFQSFSSPDQ